MKRITLRLNNPRFFRETLVEIKKAGLHPTTSDDGDFIISDYDRNADIFIENEEDIKKAINTILCLSAGKKEFDELLIGIDTNSPNLTIVVIGDGKILESSNVNLYEIEDKLNEIILSYPHKRLYIGIGTGNKYGEIVYKMLILKFPMIKKVNEKNTSNKNPYINIRDKDVRAAYLIALRATVC
ncbi:hypothetical protein DFR86_05375 [Acidianus sulfidivorans JP7]|uniref:Uncharacterized protein n=1 Tax=Acidianus sulfidivorans JP7 TaxID=619593 RepID=A0A2U9IQI7_9CREN|nr:hypothetical protein DFR86_05375 [Acidianus sulfidivorans JP7]